MKYARKRDVNEGGRREHPAFRHGMHGTPTYESWSAMRTRCLNARANMYAFGTPIHPAWDDFRAFLADVGERPPGTTLDRIDRTRPYEPGNVRWASKAVQSRNRSCTKLTEADVERIRGMIAARNKQRDIARQFGVSEALICLIKQGKKWAT